MMVTEIATQNNSFQKAFRALQESQTAAPASWLQRLRENAMARFEELGFPTTKDEEWKYTNVAPIFRAGFTPSLEETPHADIDFASFAIAETKDSQLVFVNGGLRDDLSSLTALPAEIVVLELSQAIADERYSEIVREHLARHADLVINGFTALNTAFINHGAFVYIPKGVTVEVPLNLLFISDAAGTNKVTFPRVLVVAEENSNATLLESYLSSRDEIGRAHV